MRSRRAKWGAGQPEQLPMTSMIDVVFLLLIFFMCATKFKMPEGDLRAHLPRNRGKDGASVSITKNCRVTLSAQDGRIVCRADERSISNGEWTDFEASRRREPGPKLAEIEAHIRQRKMQTPGLGPTGLPVIIDFGEDVPWKYVVDVLNICHRIEITDISFAAPAQEID
ncbi:MAG: biopolymer transporter ExbD [Planctomycetota bacterium]